LRSTGEFATLSEKRRKEEKEDNSTECPVFFIHTKKEDQREV
jgi:hypothetical protein